jgi:transcriptional regulator with XRE-family HTH domain
MDADARLKQQLREELVRRGMRQKELASQLGMSPAALNNVLAGERGLLTANAKRVLDALRLELVVQPKTAGELPASQMPPS